MKVLFLLQPGTNSRSIFLDMIDGCRGAGHEAVVLELEPMWALRQRAPQQQPAVQGDLARLVITYIQNNKVDLTVGMWANSLQTFGLTQVNGQASTVFDAINHPHLMFWLDTPERAHDASLAPLFNTGVFRSPNCFHMVNNAGSADEMQRVFNFTNSFGLRYGVNPDIFRPRDDVQREYDIMFSAGGGDRWQQPTPTMREQVDQDEPDIDLCRRELAEQLRPQLHAIAARLGAHLGPAAPAVMDRLIDAQLNDRNAPMLARFDAIKAEDASLAAAVDALLAQRPAYIEATQAIRGIENFQRAFAFAWLSRHFNCAMFGSADYAPWGCTVKSRGFVDYAQQAAEYSRAHFGLSVMRWQDEVGVHIKPIEIACSGSAVLAANRAGLEDILTPGTECVAFDNLPAARTQVESLLSNPSALTTMTQAGRARTLAHHTWSNVFTELLDKIGTLSGRWAPSTPAMCESHAA